MGRARLGFNGRATGISKGGLQAHTLRATWVASFAFDRIQIESRLPAAFIERLAIESLARGSAPCPPAERPRTFTPVSRYFRHPEGCFGGTSLEFNQNRSRKPWLARTGAPVTRASPRNFGSTPAQAARCPHTIGSPSRLTTRLPSSLLKAVTPWSLARCAGSCGLRAGRPVTPALWLLRGSPTGYRITVFLLGPTFLS